MCQVQNARTEAEFRRHRCEDWYSYLLVAPAADSIIFEFNCKFMHVMNLHVLIFHLMCHARPVFLFLLVLEIAEISRNPSEYHEIKLPTMTGSSEAPHSAPFSARVARDPNDLNWWRSQLVYSGDFAGDGLQSWTFS